MGPSLLHEGVRRGDQITNAMQLDCLPDGSVIEQHQPLLSSTRILHTKQFGLWRSDFFSYSDMAYSGSHMSGSLSGARVIGLSEWRVSFVDHAAEDCFKIESMPEISATAFRNAFLNSYKRVRAAFNDETWPEVCPPPEWTKLMLWQSTETYNQDSRFETAADRCWRRRHPNSSFIIEILNS